MDGFSIFDVIGLSGAFIYILSYVLVQLHRDFAKDLGYSGLNLLGAVLISISLWENFNLSAFIVQTIWIFISLYGIYRCLKYKFHGHSKMALIKKDIVS